MEPEPDLEGPARCARHPAVAAAAACERCGRFACDACGRTEDQRFLCAECLARPEVRLAASPRARRSLWLALIGFHGLLVLLPVAFWIARAELSAIERGDAPGAGRPWAQGAMAICGVGAVIWLIIAMVAIG